LYTVSTVCTRKRVRYASGQADHTHPNIPAGQFIMSVSQPGCPLCGEADIVQRLAISGTFVAAASIKDTTAVKYQGQEALSTPAHLSIHSPLSLILSKSIHASSHRAGAPLQRRNPRQQAKKSTSLSDVLFILIEENFSNIITDH
jgi:hypothetical protein